MLMCLMQQDLLIGTVVMCLMRNDQDSKRKEDESECRDEAALTQWPAPMSSCSVMRGMPARRPSM